ncbi:cobalamin biosynthesis protein [Roseovarius tibetensis]|uniref:cobalamin biosynthesis protein n=1 Tax=Roseovarius tibetensis TaxID=2685897 RepID=UPI003D7F7F64
MIVAGFGFSTRARDDSLRDALRLACARAGISGPDALATAQDKATALNALSQALGVPVHPVSQETLATQTTQTQSARVTAERATGSLAEAAALAAAGTGARLLSPRIHAQDRLASCAIAKGVSS